MTSSASWWPPGGLCWPRCDIANPAVAEPFEWKLTRADLARMMKRVAAKEDYRPAA